MLKRVMEKCRQTASFLGEEEPAAGSSHIEWVVAFCLGVAAQPDQTTTSSSKMYVESGLVLVMCSFAFLFMSKCKCFGSVTCRVMQKLGLLFGVTAFFIRSTCQSSVWLKCMGWTVYALTWLAIFVFAAIINGPVLASPSLPLTQPAPV